jgi:uncharacterized protein with PQ loop repeat
MEEIFGLMAFVGAFTFIAMGLCIANSIEAKESKVVASTMTIIMVIGIACFLIGFFGILIMLVF